MTPAKTEVAITGATHLKNLHFMTSASPGNPLNQTVLCDVSLGIIIIKLYLHTFKSGTAVPFTGVYKH